LPAVDNTVSEKDHCSVKVTSNYLNLNKLKKEKNKLLVVLTTFLIVIFFIRNTPDLRLMHYQRPEIYNFTCKKRFEKVNRVAVRWNCATRRNGIQQRMEVLNGPVFLQLHKPIVLGHLKLMGTFRKYR
jgi:hypothetical protein